MRKSVRPARSERHTARPIDTSASTSYHSFTSGFAVVSKVRAEIWLLIAAVLFLAGFIAAIVYVSHQGEDQQFAAIPQSAVEAATRTSELNKTMKDAAGTLKSRFATRNKKTTAVQAALGVQNERLALLTETASKCGSIAPDCIKDLLLDAPTRAALNASGVKTEQVVNAEDATLVLHHSDCFDASGVTCSRTSPVITMANGQQYALRGKATTDILNVPLDVTVATFNGLAVPLTTPQTATPPRAVALTGNKKFAIALLGSGQSAAPFSGADVQKAMADVTAFYERESGGQMNITYDVMTGSVDTSIFSCLRTNGADQANQAANISGSYDYYVYVFPAISCTGGNPSSERTAAWVDIGGNKLFINGNGASLTQTITHESGHSLSLGHAGRGTMTTIDSTYGHNFDVMGNKVYPPSGGSFSSIHKQIAGFPIDVQTVTQAGTYDLNPVDDPSVSGVRGLAVNIGGVAFRLDSRKGGSSLVVERRTDPTDKDNLGYVDVVQMATLSSGQRFTAGTVTVTYNGGGQVTVAVNGSDTGSGATTGSSTSTGTGDSSGTGNDNSTPPPIDNGGDGSLGTNACDSSGCFSLVCPSGTVTATAGHLVTIRISAQGDYPSGIAASIVNRPASGGIYSGQVPDQGTAALSVNIPAFLPITILPTVGAGTYTVPIRGAGLSHALNSPALYSTCTFPLEVLTTDSGNPSQGDFSLACPLSQTVNPGSRPPLNIESAFYYVPVRPVGGFNSAVNFEATVTPQLAGDGTNPITLTQYSLTPSGVASFRVDANVSDKSAQPYTIHFTAVSGGIRHSCNIPLIVGGTPTAPNPAPGVEPPAVIDEDGNILGNSEGTGQISSCSPINRVAFLGETLSYQVTTRNHSQPLTLVIDQNNSVVSSDAGYTQAQIIELMAKVIDLNSQGTAAAPGINNFPIRTIGVGGGKTPSARIAIIAKNGSQTVGSCTVGVSFRAGEVPGTTYQPVLKVNGSTRPAAINPGDTVLLQWVDGIGRCEIFANQNRLVPEGMQEYPPGSPLPLSDPLGIYGQAHHTPLFAGTVAYKVSCQGATRASSVTVSLQVGSGSSATPPLQPETGSGSTTGSGGTTGSGTTTGSSTTGGTSTTGTGSSTTGSGTTGSGASDPRVILTGVPSGTATGSFTVTAHVEGQLDYDRIRILVDNGGIENSIGTCRIADEGLNCTRTISITGLRPGTHTIWANARKGSDGVMQSPKQTFRTP